MARVVGPRPGGVIRTAGDSRPVITTGWKGRMTQGTPGAVRPRHRSPDFFRSLRRPVLPPLIPLPSWHSLSPRVPPAAAAEGPGAPPAPSRHIGAACRTAARRVPERRARAHRRAHPARPAGFTCRRVTTAERSRNRPGDRLRYSCRSRRPAPEIDYAGVRRTGCTDPREARTMLVGGRPSARDRGPAAMTASECPAGAAPRAQSTLRDRAALPPAPGAARPQAPPVRPARPA